MFGGAVFANILIMVVNIIFSVHNLPRLLMKAVIIEVIFKLNMKGAKHYFIALTMENCVSAKKVS